MDCLEVPHAPLQAAPLEEALRAAGCITAVHYRGGPDADHPGFLMFRNIASTDGRMASIIATVLNTHVEVAPIIHEAPDDPVEARLALLEAKLARLLPDEE